MPSKKQRAKAARASRQPVTKIANCMICRSAAADNAHIVTITGSTYCGKSCVWLCNACNTKENIRLSKELIQEDHSVGQSRTSKKGQRGGRTKKKKK